MRKYFIKDSKGRPSITTTAFFLGFIIVNIKFLIGGLYGITSISGVEYGAAMASLGGIYVMRNNRDKSEDKE